MSDDPDLGVQLSKLHDHLEATASLPIDPAANRWLGEAEAVAADLGEGGAEEETIERRVGHVSMLLDRMDDTGHPAAEEHVEAARERIDRIEMRLGES